MKKRIRKLMFLSSLSVLLAGLLLAVVISHRYFAQIQSEQLQAQLELAACAVEESGADYLKQLKPQEYRLTLVAENGAVLYDTEAREAMTENHGNRVEIASALQDGAGTSVRYSATMLERTVYLARRLTNGTVLRISAGYATTLSLLVRMLPMLLFVTALAAVLSARIASRLSGWIVAPFSMLNLERPLDNEVYEELSPLLLRISEQNRQIAGQVEQLRQAKQEFATITGSMREALILLNRREQVISVNPAAQALFGTGDTVIGKPFLMLERHPGISRCIEKAVSEGHAETAWERSGRIYRVLTSRIPEEGEMTGVVVLVLDETEKAQAEQVRREFTANVSHELKTPLQAIMGSAELLENGMVKPEDTKKFLGHIRSEAARLLSLITDIIRLSQLEETQETRTEAVELEGVIREAVGVLQPFSEQKGITLRLFTEELWIDSVREYWYEIVYHLCENAIRYNKESGEVTVELRKEQNKVVLRVTDSGIGIAAEHQERIFERFYRVDKSRSRQTGGTGLGLSIVKHAVQAIGAVILVRSEPEVGTCMTVVFQPEKKENSLPPWE